MTETMIAVDGGEVWADDSGGDGPPLMLLHPGVGDSRIWDLVLSALAASYRVIRYDARGFGRSPAAAVQYCLLDDLVVVLDYYRITRTAVVGCSQGGDSALGLAVTQPGRVSALVLLCPGVSGYRWPDQAELAAEFDRAAAQGEDALAELGLRLFAAAGRTPEAVQQLRSAARAWLSSADLMEVNPPVFDRLGEITVPTSLLVGDIDRPALIECNRQIAARIPGCELIEIPGVDHLPPLRVPDQTLQVIGRTLARIPATP